MEAWPAATPGTGTGGSAIAKSREIVCEQFGHAARGVLPDWLEIPWTCERARFRFARRNCLRCWFVKKQA